MLWLKWVRLFGVVLFVWILSKLDWGTVLNSLRNLNPAYLAAYVICFACMILVRVIRLRLCVTKAGGSLRFLDSYLATLEPAFIGVVTPGRVGELTRITHLQRALTLHSSIALVGLERIIDLAILFAFGLGGSIYIFGPSAFKAFGLVATSLGLLVIYAFFREFDRVAPLLQPVFALLSRTRLPFRKVPATLLAATQETVRATASPMLLLGTVCIVLNLSQIFVLSRAFAFHADTIVICFAYIVATLLSLVPISPSGLGTREATYIYIMAQQGIAKEQALLFAFLDAVVLGPIGVLIMLAPFWITQSASRSYRRTTTQGAKYLELLWKSIRKRGVIATLIFIVNESFFDLKFRTSTRKPVFVEDLQSNTNREHAVSYEPVNYSLLKKVFHFLFNSGRIDPQHTCLVDFGCGKGRVLIVALHYGIRNVVGVDFDKRLCDICTTNIRRYLDRCGGLDRRWRVMHEDAATFQIPPDTNLFFLYNPFSGPVLQSVAEQIAEVCRSSGRVNTVVYINPVHSAVFEQLGFVRLAECNTEFAVYTI